MRISSLTTILPYTQLTKVREIYPIDYVTAKKHLRIDEDFEDDDEYIDTLCITATQLAENYLNKAIAKTLNTLRIDDFDDNWLQVMEGNFLSVVSVLDANNRAIGTIHQTSSHYDYFTIEWTTTISSNPLTVNFYTGYNDGETPELIKQAILIKVADLYDNQRSSLNWSGMQDSKVFETILNGFIAIRF